MVNAIVKGNKTQTRRKTGLERYSDPNDAEIKDNPCRWLLGGFSDGAQWIDDLDTLEGEWVKCPYGKPGDLLWVRETFAEYSGEVDGDYAYRADLINMAYMEAAQSYREKGLLSKWKPSIHMPKKAARIWLEVDDIRTERLQDISEEDAKAEGVHPIAAHNDQSRILGWHDYKVKPKDGFNTFFNPIESFCSLWELINGDESWQTNPWVWVVKFKVLSTEGRPNVLP